MNNVMMLMSIAADTSSKIPYEVRIALSATLMILMVLASIAMIVVVLMQKGNEAGIGAINGSTETFFGKNKSQSKEGKLKRATVIIAISLLVISILYFVLQIIK